MSGAVREREGTVVLRACAMTRDCAADLLTLSLLFPAAPWVRSNVYLSTNCYSYIVISLVNIS